MEQGNKRMDDNPLNHFGAAKLTFDELETITNSIPGGVVQLAHDEDLTLLYANDGFYRICGYPREELAGKSGWDIFRMLVPPEELKSVTESAVEQLRFGSEIKFECRIVRKDGKPVWVRVNAACSPSSSRGAEVIRCIFVDITSEKQLSQKLQNEQERYRMITEQLNDIFFEYNFENDTIYTSSKWEELFGYPLPRENILASLPASELVYDDDKEALLQIVERARQGIPSGELEVRFRRAGGGYIWTSMSITVVCDDLGSPVKAIGKIADIDERMREREKLISSAQRDPLTRLYNKVAVESFIRSCLRATDGNIRHALMIIDVDNFKGVNDNLGHLFGDAVLSEISVKLRTLFRSTDILGRFGGDEFVVFLKNVGENEKIAQKAQAVCDIFRETYTGENKDYKISGSVGISIYPEDGKNFYELFKNADSALYEAKARGKDGFVICGADENTKEKAADSNVQPLRRSSQQVMKNSLTMDIYEMLCETKDGHGAIQFILRMIGREFSADRVYIYEKGWNGFSNTYEWSAEGRKPGENEKSPYGDFSNAKFRFQSEGFYYCPDVNAAEVQDGVFRCLKARSVQSFLQCPVFEGDVLQAVVGFDFKTACSDNERETLTEIAKIIGSFLLKYRFRQELKAERDLFQTMTESIHLWSYVIDPETYHLMYVNPTVRRKAPDARIGDFCYRTLKSRKELCENCPAEELKQTAAPTCADIYDSERDLWFSATAAPVDWEGDKKALICQTDITRFIKAGNEPGKQKTDNN